MNKLFALWVLMISVLVPFECPALMPIDNGTVAYANKKISTVDGTGFVDLGATINLGTNYPSGWYIKICDSAAKCIYGYTKSAGTSETTSATNKLSAYSNFTSGWTALTSTIDNATAYHTTGNGGVYRGGLLTLGELYKFSYAGTKTSTSVGAENASGHNAVAVISSDFASNVYWTDISGSVYFRNLGAGNTEITSMSAYKVLTPSSTGVWIVSTYDGTTYNWATKDAGFNPNDFTGYTYTIYPGAVATTVNGDNQAINYSLIDCQDDPGKLGLDVTGAGFVGQNLTVVRCPAGAYQFENDATLTNSIGISTGEDIRIATDNTVTGTYNLFDNAAKAGAGTYSDAGSTTKWSSNPRFNGAADFTLLSSSPAINAGVDVGLTADYAGNAVPFLGGKVDIGAYEFQSGDPWTIGGGGKFITFPRFPLFPSIQ